MMKTQRFIMLLASRVVLILGLLAVFAFTAFNEASAKPAAIAFVRVVDASPVSGNVDVFVDGRSLLSSIAFGTVTNYLQVPTGSHTVKVARAGSGIGAAFLTQTFTLGTGAYTVAGLGTRATGYSIQTFVDNNLVTRGQTKVRVYHLSPNAGLVNVLLSARTLISGLTYRSASPYLTLSPGSRTFNVRVANGRTTIPVTATLGANTVDSIFALGLYGGTPPLRFVIGAVNGIPG